MVNPQIRDMECSVSCVFYLAAHCIHYLQQRSSPACSLDKIRIHIEELILYSIQACNLVEEGPNAGKRL
jgi:hypothetical protein